MTLLASIVGASKTKCHWRGDVHNMSKRLKAYQTNIALGKFGAKKALEDFIISRLVLVAQTNIVGSIRRLFLCLLKLLHRLPEIAKNG